MGTAMEGKTIADIAQQQVENSLSIIVAQGIEKLSVQAVMEKNKDILKNNTKGTTQEKMINIYADIQGYNGHMSDEMYNTLIEVSKEIMIQVVVCTVSMGVANVAMNTAK